MEGSHRSQRGPQIAVAKATDPASEQFFLDAVAKASERANVLQEQSTIMAQIAAASGEQTLGIEQVNGAVTQMDQVTQENAALVEEAAASDAPREQAKTLSQLVATFRLDGREAQPAPAAPAGRVPQVRPALAAA